MEPLLDQVAERMRPLRRAARTGEATEADALELIGLTAGLPDWMAFAPITLAHRAVPDNATVAREIRILELPAFAREQVARKLAALLAELTDVTPARFAFVAEGVQELKAEVPTARLARGRGPGWGRGLPPRLDPWGGLRLDLLGPLAIRAEGGDAEAVGLISSLFGRSGRPRRSLGRLAELMPWLAPRLAATLPVAEAPGPIAGPLAAVSLSAMAASLVAASLGPGGGVASTTVDRWLWGLAAAFAACALASAGAWVAGRNPPPRPTAASPRAEGVLSR